ncbi:MAG: 4Fe-4S dicluster domain-containing protein [Chloroflexi bacterium]|nr:4Fe-4S dicluster domain-containing protein [Chloroflexota bacterium]
MTNKQTPIYSQRKLLRWFEKQWTSLEGVINRFSTVSEKTRPYNPFYHTGTLLIFLLIVLTVTGLYLTIFYRPGTELAFQSVSDMNSFWLGSLMRTVHRYASDGLLIVTFVHALKMFFSDRFWGSRWLAWISGWAILVLFWIIGLMGYWLVWDTGAQWLTEYFIELVHGPFAYSFLETDVASSTFSLFVIVLFLHIFVPILLVVGVIVHVLRLTRAKYWAPRWLMGASVLALVILAILNPVVEGEPANLFLLTGQVQVDWWYLGFLPIAQQFGNPVFWTISLVLLLIAIALPWLWGGQHDGPAVVIESNCTGCAACARECPFDAIDMAERDDATEYISLAVVKPNLCTGCGICVGSCPDVAIELDRLHSPVMRQDLRRTLVRAEADDKPTITVFACDRQATLGTLPPLANPQSAAAAMPGLDGSIPLLQAKQSPRVNVGSWPDSKNEHHAVMTCVVPCTGMLHPNWATETIDAGGAGAIVVSCPGHDCAYREGPNWIRNRLHRRRTLRKGNTHFLEVAPGNQEAVLSLWGKMIGDEAQAASAKQAVTVVGKSKEVASPSIGQQVRYLLPGFVILLVVFFLSTLIYRPFESPTIADEAKIRLVINHSGQLVNTAANLSADVLEKLPDNVDPSQVLGGERFPVKIRLVVDGEIVSESEYEAGGLRNEGSIYAIEAWETTPGEHHIEIWLNDNDAEWWNAFDGIVDVPSGGVTGLFFDRIEKMFEVQ